MRPNVLVETPKEVSPPLEFRMPDYIPAEWIKEPALVQPGEAVLPPALQRSIGRVATQNTRGANKNGNYNYDVTAFNSSV